MIKKGTKQINEVAIGIPALLCVIVFLVSKSKTNAEVDEWLRAKRYGAVSCSPNGFIAKEFIYSHESMNEAMPGTNDKNGCSHQLGNAGAVCGIGASKRRFLRISLCERS